MRIVMVFLAAAACAAAAEREVDPTFLYRHVPDLPYKAAAFTTPGCRYKPVFGEGDSHARLLRGITRFGEIRVEPGGACEPLDYAGEEQVYVILEGNGEVAYATGSVPVRRNDFMYLAPGVRRALSNKSAAPLRAIVMGFRVPASAKAPPPAKMPLANIDEVKKEVVGGHPPTTLYQLLMGAADSKRDRIAAARVLTSLFIMEFAPGGTNFPHHHDSEEEIYLVLDGHGDMVAGGGADGVENRRPAKAGDAYFFRLNCTVGFYNSNVAGEPKAHILAVRSLFPRRER